MVHITYREDGSNEAQTTALCRFVNQLDTARRFVSNMVTRQSVLWMIQHHNLYPGGIIMVCVGIDVAKYKHDCFILNLEGEVQSNVFTITNYREGFEILLQRIQSCVRSTDKVKVGLEATGHYIYNILGFLLDKGLATYVINPLHTNQY